jgi:hypothetical protein
MKLRRRMQLTLGRGQQGNLEFAWEQLVRELQILLEESTPLLQMVYQ